MSDNGQAHTTLAAFTVDSGDAARRLLKAVQRIDAANDNVQIVDAAVVDRGRFGRISVHQTTDRGALKTGVRVGTLGVVVGAIVAGPAGAVAMGAAGGVLGGLRGGIHDTGIDDKFMRSVSKEIEKKKSALFVLYEGTWEHSIGLIEQAITDEHALLFNSTLPADKAAALQALVAPAVEALGGEEVVADYELEVAETPEAAPEAGAAPVEEVAAVAAVAAVAPAEARADDLTQLVGIGPKAAAALAAAGVTTFAALAELNEPQVRRALHDSDMTPPANVGTWPMQASLAAKGDWQGLMKYNNRAAASRPAPEKAAAVAAAAVPAEPSDDLTQLHGIGPRIASILNDGGITSYNQLQHANTGELRQIIATGGALPPSSLESWPTQATYAARGDWEGLAAYNRR
jgi:predicted flap endonuclease-1-like 5' DNA nuclease